MVWQPMTLEQKASDHPAHHAYCWGLIVGYNESEETYTVRHPFVDGAYTVRYDDIGHADPAELFSVLVYEGPSAEKDESIHLTALRNAVAFAHATRFAADDEQAMPGGEPGRTVLQPTNSGARRFWMRRSYIHVPSSHHCVL